MVAHQSLVRQKMPLVLMIIPLMIIMLLTQPIHHDIQTQDILNRTLNQWMMKDGDTNLIEEFGSIWLNKEMNQ
jgi:hypothetical protein